MNTPGNSAGKPSWWIRLWRQPQKRWLFCVPVGGFLTFIVGVLFWGGFHTTIAMTNSLAFCTSCHEMRDNVYQEYKTSVHYANAYGVRAICTDCHVPKSWGPMMVRKITATRELFFHFTGSVATKEMFEAKRLQMAEDVWRQMRATNSRECRNCHSFSAMNLTAQSRQAARKHAPEWIAKTGKTCIDCHQGVVHKLPVLVR